MKERKDSKVITDKDFQRLITSKNVQKAVMVKNNQVFKHGYEN